MGTNTAATLSIHIHYVVSEPIKIVYYGMEGEKTDPREINFFEGLIGKKEKKEEEEEEGEG